jgi:hypothetical protein
LSNAWKSAPRTDKVDKENPSIRSSYASSSSFHSYPTIWDSNPPIDGNFRCTKVCCFHRSRSSHAWGCRTSAARSPSSKRKGGTSATSSSPLEGRFVREQVPAFVTDAVRTAQRQRTDAASHWEPLPPPLHPPVLYYSTPLHVTFDLCHGSGSAPRLPSGAAR